MSIIVGERQVFYDMKRLKETMSTKPAFQRVLETIQRTEERNGYTQGQQKETKWFNCGTTKLDEECKKKLK